MRLPQHIINKAYNLHYMLVESHKTLNKNLLEPALSDEKRISCYIAYFSTCEEVRNSVTEIINQLGELKTQSCFSFFRESNEAVKYFLAITYDQKNFESLEEIRRMHDPFIKAIALPLHFRKGSIPTLHFYDNGFLVVSTQNKRFKSLFQRSIEKTRDLFLENKLKAEIMAVKENTALTSTQRAEEIDVLVKKAEFRHPFFLNKYRGYSPLRTLALKSPSNDTHFEIR